MPPVRGCLTKDKLGFSMPSYAPLFPKPPYLYKNASLMVFPYETSDVAAQMIPNVMELADPPTAALVFASYPSSTLGPYDEVVQYVDVSFKGVKYRFATFLYVTTDSAMAAGREMGGYPKKIGKIEFLPAGGLRPCSSGRLVCAFARAQCCAEQQVPAAKVPTPMAHRLPDASLLSQPAGQPAAHIVRDLADSVDGQPR